MLILQQINCIASKMVRKKAFEPEDFLRAVKRLNTLSDVSLARFLGCDRSSVFRFKANKKNKKYVDEAKTYIEELADENITPSRMTWDIYLTLPKIRQWIDAMNARMVSQGKQRAWLRSFYNLCKHMKTTPGRMKLEDAARVCVEQRRRYYAEDPNDPQVKGIAYTTIRESIRGFYMSVQNVSPMFLTNLGVTKEALKGKGKYARQRVNKAQRDKFEQLCFDYFKESGDIRYLECYGSGVFMGSTATRITPTLEFNVNVNECELKPNKWTLVTIEKGTKGKKKYWRKLLMGANLTRFKKYLELRFDIPFDEIEDKIGNVTDHFFPSFINGGGRVQDSAMAKYMKKLLIESGVSYKEFPPNHIWRHTFAQEFLEASDWNYELTADLGGWVNTTILKGHYGEMGEAARERGLLKAMGEEIPDHSKDFVW